MATEIPESKRKGGGGKLSRSEVVTVRMDSQLHYLAELAARKHRRTLSSFVEWAVQQSFKTVEVYHGSGYNGDASVFLSDEESSLWDVDPGERFARLAIKYPDLLTHEEQERWKLLTDSQLLAPAMRRSSGTNGVRFWDWPTLEDVVFPVLRRHWVALVAAHDAGPEAGRKWVSDIQEKITAGAIYKKKAAFKEVAPSGFDDMTDDIPF